MWNPGAGGRQQQKTTTGAMALAWAYKRSTTHDWKHSALLDESQVLLRHSEIEVKFWWSQHDNMDPSRYQGFRLMVEWSRDVVLVHFGLQDQMNFQSNGPSVDDPLVTRVEHAMSTIWWNRRLAALKYTNLSAIPDQKILANNCEKLAEGYLKYLITKMIPYHVTWLGSGNEILSLLVCRNPRSGPLQQQRLSTNNHQMTNKKYSIS